jgi:hypothetical protein
LVSLMASQGPELKAGNLVEKCPWIKRKCRLQGAREALKSPH